MGFLPVFVRDLLVVVAFMLAAVLALRGAWFVALRCPRANPVAFATRFGLYAAAVAFALLAVLALVELVAASFRGVW